MSWVDICTLYKFSKVYEHTKLQGYSKVEFFSISILIQARTIVKHLSVNSYNILYRRLYRSFEEFLKALTCVYLHMYTPFHTSYISRYIQRIRLQCHPVTTIYGMYSYHSTHGCGNLFIRLKVSYGSLKDNESQRTCISVTILW